MLHANLSQGAKPTDSERGEVRASQEASPREGILPPVGLETARITPEGRLVLGKVSFPGESIAECLRSASKLSTAMRSYFQEANHLGFLIPDGAVVKLPGSEDMYAAWASLDDVFGEGEFRRDIHPWMVALSGSAKERVLQPAELMQLRDLLRMGARIATACCAIDETIAHRQASRSVVGKAIDWFRRSDSTVRATDVYLQTQPFQDYHPHFLRIELDKWAQRIDLRRDGSPLVRLVCEREAVARKVIDSGSYAREVVLADGVVSSRLTVRDDRAGHIILQSEHHLRNLYSILSVAKSASGLIQNLERQGVNLVRLCSLSHRGSFVGMSRCVTQLYPQTHIRLDAVESWAPRFDVRESQALSAEEVAELGAILLDAEAVLYTLSHLQQAVLGEEQESLWRSKWTKATNDKEYRAALALVNQRPSPLECDCIEAGEVAATAALILGYSSDERTGASWHIPESPLQSFAWIIDNGTSSSQDE